MVKSRTNETAGPLGYPCLKRLRDGDFVVLFTAPAEGFVVHRGTSQWSLGMFQDPWAEDVFVPFHGTVTLES